MSFFIKILEKSNQLKIFFLIFSFVKSLLVKLLFNNLFEILSIILKLSSKYFKSIYFNNQRRVFSLDIYFISSNLFEFIFLL